MATKLLGGAAIKIKKTVLTRITIVTRMDPGDLKQVTHELLVASRALSNAILKLNEIVAKSGLEAEAKHPKAFASTEDDPEPGPA